MAAPLPVMALREKIVEKIRENRVTLIVGDTGCGKSSQVPQFLLEENMEPILCTQPRRFAVVAIARMVAKSRNCEVGGEIGYHIGHSNVSDLNSKKSRIIFKTAGVLLEQMRDKGLAALKYKVIILDEVHERSVESDLVLACVKQFMLKNNDLRVVLMSATADITRYRDYFRDLGRGERVEVIAIPSSSQNSIFQRKVSYLEQVGDILNVNIDSISTKFHSWTDPSCVKADLSPDLHQVIHKLILHIHENESDIEKSILVFLPTYSSLEQQWEKLNSPGSVFKVHILHRSIDTNQALLAMRVSKSRRKVILATNIAESSVTIPGVAYVIDLCRSLQVYWDSNRKKDSSELVWVSKSQAEQRKGRTGRTCDGEIYRLVTRSFYNNLSDHEYPAILRLSLRQQVLTMCCAESKAISDPKVLLQKVLDPPDPDIMEDALGSLVQIGALEKLQTVRPRYEPTFYGRLIDSLPLSFDASVLALKFGEIGFLREGILISIMCDVQPLPIVQPFGNQALYSDYVSNYFEDESCSSLIGKRETNFIGNLCAFQFWQRVFKDKQRLERLKQKVKTDELSTADSLILNLEEDWCMLHNLVQSSLHNISEIYDDVLDAIHRLRPGFLAKLEPPLHFKPSHFNHACTIQSEILTDLVENLASLALLEDEQDGLNLVSKRKCVNVPYVKSSDFQAKFIAEKLQKLIVEIKIENTEDKQLNSETVLPAGESILCRFFTKGCCIKGTDCPFSHSFKAERPPCKFYLTLQGCRNGDSCFFSHDSGPHSSPVNLVSLPKPSLQEEFAPSLNRFIQLLPNNSKAERILVFNDKELHFSTVLSHYYEPSKIISATPLSYSPESESLAMGISVIWDLIDPVCLFIKGDWKGVRCVLWFADFNANDLISKQQREVQEFFELLAVRGFAESLCDLRVILTMNNAKFTQLQVDRLARDCFFYLSESFPFDESTLGNFSKNYGPARPMQICAPISYVFNLHPPNKIQFGDYASELYQSLQKKKQVY